MCEQSLLEQHTLDRSQLDDRVPPGPVEVMAWVEEPEDGGCGGTPKCGEGGRTLVLVVRASDDRTAPDRLGFRVDVTHGTAPFAAPGDLRAVDDQIRIPLDGSRGGDFELAVRAVDLNGNLGPATYSRMTQSDATGGCASAGLVSFGMVVLVLISLVLRHK